MKFGYLRKKSTAGCSRMGISTGFGDGNGFLRGNLGCLAGNIELDYILYIIMYTMLKLC